MAKNNDSLFLLEVLIDKVVFIKSPCFSDKDFRTCVNIECPSVQPLEICDDDPGACIAKSGGPFVKTFNSGKSCLFSLHESDISAAMNKFPIKVSVYKSLPCGCLPTKIVLGEATIDMTKEFVEARKKFLEDPTNVSYQALKDSFRIFGPDGAETGEVVMFLRISCFGKLIVTKFQGGGGTPNLGASDSNAVVDRSCTPKRDFQTSQNPCVCGAARSGSGRAGSGSNRQTCLSGGGTGICHSARDPYNSMPCADPDDPCFCSGPMPREKQKMACRNTDQYCLHVPKGAPSSAICWQEQTKEQRNDKKTQNVEQEHQRLYGFITTYLNGWNSLVYPQRQIDTTTTNCLQCSANKIKLQDIWHHSSRTPMCSNKNSKLSSSHTSTKILIRSQSSICSTVDDFHSGLFGKQEIKVCMALFNDYYHYRASGTQATALINKCLQVNKDICNGYDARTFNTNSNYESTSTISTSTSRQSRKRAIENPCYHNVYFFGRKKEVVNTEGMGCKGSCSKLRKTDQSPNTAIKSDVSGTNIKLESQTKLHSSTTSLPKSPKITKGASTSTNTVKSVSIKDNKVKKPCPSSGSIKGDMAATVSHIRIGPREPCPVHCKELCQGPNCIASSGEQAPVKVTTVTNPRRGVFELVIRKITGAPLATNELMLEWTPPPCRPAPCGNPIPIPCALPTPYRPHKCKRLVCPSPPCKPKHCKKPCGPGPCCKTSCCTKKCYPCGPPPSCKLPCPIVCAPPCCRSPCKSPCKSSPCLRLCPVGQKRTRKVRSQPKIKAMRKRVSPCLNGSKTCPVVRCRSMPGPCIGCCGIPPCPLRKCRSVAPWRPPKCCRSSYSSCCV